MAVVDAGQELDIQPSLAIYVCFVWQACVESHETDQHFVKSEAGHHCNSGSNSLQLPHFGQRILFVSIKIATVDSVSNVLVVTLV